MVHVLDASRAVGVVNQLLGERNACAVCVAHARTSTGRIRVAREPRRARRACSPSRMRADGASRTGHRRRPHRCRRFLGTRIFDDYPLAELVERIDWTPFFQTWELRGRYPAILDDAMVGEQARSLFDDARAHAERIRARATV